MAVRRATEQDVPTLAAALARAFHEDPVTCYLFPEARRRAAALPRFFDIHLRREGLPHGEVYTNEGLEGAAVWMPPEGRRPTLRSVLALYPLVPLIGRRLGRALRLFQLMDARHPREPHYYLAVLGTEPARQGKGVGSALLGPVLERCDAEGLPSYLESSNPRNVPFYSRHGFEVTGEIALPRGPVLHLMWRKAAS
ncbi:MAG TPA: GNAT family N-acetyltransferase [Acidimicrobiales bacterium]|nr:GNAT family N-acetyltransferase [Acidimicrobiales bacterium]